MEACNRVERPFPAGLLGPPMRPRPLLVHQWAVESSHQVSGGCLPLRRTCSRLCCAGRRCLSSGRAPGRRWQGSSCRRAWPRSRTPPWRRPAATPVAPTRRARTTCCSSATAPAGRPLPTRAPAPCHALCADQPVLVPASVLDAAQYAPVASATAGTSMVACVARILVEN